MKDDYLWDKTGEADPGLQHLERVLGQLRHRRTAKDLPPFEIKPHLWPRVSRKMLAMAAALAFAVLAVGLYAALQREGKNQATSNARVAMANPDFSDPLTDRERAAPNVADIADTAQKNQPVKVSGPKPPVLVSNRRLGRRRELLDYEREQAAGLMAKEQLIKALSITSSKLNFVQKKVQGEEKLRPSS